MDKTQITPTDTAPPKLLEQQVHAELLEVAPELLRNNPWRPGGSVYDTANVRAIAESMAQHGQIVWALARRRAAGPPGYELAHGHDRREAVRLLLSEGRWSGGVKVEVRPITDREMVFYAHAENDKRKNVKPLDICRAYKQALETVEGLTIADLAKGLSLDRSTVSNGLRILNLPLVVLERVDSGELSLHGAREFLCLWAEDHVHTTEMEEVIRTIAKESYGHAPDWRVGNVRKLIAESVVGARVEQWRPLDKLPKGTDKAYTWWSTRGAEPRFDVKEFQRQHPTKVHNIPWDDNGRGVLYTCACSAWRSWQERAERPTTLQERQQAAERLARICQIGEE